jgi:hypothetical protein
MSPLLQPVQDLARAAACALRAALRQGALICAALLIALPGAAFLLFAGYIGLRFLVGPGLAALAIGSALLALAAGLLLLARSVKRNVPPIAVATPQGNVKATQTTSADAATMAVFTAAFLLGRRLAERLADRHGPSSNP